MDSNCDRRFKIVLLGGNNIGKTWLKMEFCGQPFPDVVFATIGVGFGSKFVEIDGKRIRLEIWDTAGNERYASNTKKFLRGAHGVLLIYSYCDQDNFQDVKYWADFLEGCGCKISEGAVALVGNKADIPDDERMINLSECQGFATMMGISVFEVSVKEKRNVDAPFMYLAKKILSRAESGMTEPLV